MSPVREGVNSDFTRCAFVDRGRSGGRAGCRRKRGVGRSLVEEQCAVEGVALDWFEAGFADDAAEFFFGGAAGFAEAFFEEDGADIVAAEAEAHLQNLEALCGPRALEVGNIVEVKAAYSQSREVLHCSGFRDIGGNSDVAGQCGERGEGGKTARFFLQGAEDFEVVDAVGYGFANAEDHGGFSGQA